MDSYIYFSGDEIGFNVPEERGSRVLSKDEIVGNLLGLSYGRCRGLVNLVEVSNFIINICYWK